MDEFAINPTVLIAQIINFGIVLFLLKKFVYKPVLSMLEARRKTIEEGLKSAEEAKVELSKAEEKATEIRDKAYAEAKIMNEEAKTTAATSANDIIVKANTQADQIVKFAEKEALNAKNNALSEAREQIGSIVILALEKILGNELDASQREKITAKTIKDL